MVKKRKELEAYYHCENRQEQELFWSEIEAKVFPEPRYLQEKKERELKWRRHYKRERFEWKKEEYATVI